MSENLQCNFELPHDLIYEMITYLSPTTIKNLKMSNKHYNLIDLTNKYFWTKKYSYDNFVFNSSMLYNIQEYQDILTLKQLIQNKNIKFIVRKKPWIINDIKLVHQNIKNNIEDMIDNKAVFYINIVNLTINIKIFGTNSNLWIDDEIEQHEVLKLAYLYCDDMGIN
jgi:hypothetical protein